MSIDARSLCLLGLLLLPAAAACRKSGDAVEVDPNDADRRDLVLQPMGEPPPSDAAVKLSIQLIAETTKIRKGEKFRYRVETRNAGSAPFRFREAAPSFIKDGGLCAAEGFRFVLAASDGREQTAACDPADAKGGSAPLDVTLAPGEYLLTRPESAKSRFRDLRTAFKFDRTGRYKLKLVYADAKARAESNPVDLEVVR